MPYILISTTIRLENGPTVVGDENSNAEIMNYLNAKLHCSAGSLCNIFFSIIVVDTLQLPFLVFELKILLTFYTMFYFLIFNYYRNILITNKPIKRYWLLHLVCFKSYSLQSTL